jgi:outer membrane receptor for ferrienterochelin and colicins
MSRAATRSAFLQPTLLALAAAACASASAQAPKPPLTTMSEVVVTATGFEQELKQAPASISVVSRQELETKNFRDLAEALQSVEGIDVGSSTGKTGGLDISIRGMPSEYTLILIDGRRQNVAGDITPNGFGGALTSFMPPVSAIERIEVIRGPMSTLYGSDAMGGVVNIITRKVAKEWGGEVGITAGVPTDDSWGNQARANVYLNGPIKQDVMGLAVRASVYQREASDFILAPGATQPALGQRNPAPAESRQHNIGARLTLTPNRYHDLWLDVDQARTWYNNDDGRLGNLDANPRNPGGYTDFMRFNRDQVAVGHVARLGYGTLESSLMHTETETIGRTIPAAATSATDPRRGAPRELKTSNLVLDSKFVSPINDSHVFTVGGQWWDAEVTDGILTKKANQTMWALFAENEWTIRDGLTATFGGRYDRHDAFGGNFSPRAYVVWDASSNWTVKGGVSKGFKVPRLNQLIDGVSGITGQGTVVSIGNPNLKPEVSTSTELSALYDSKRGLTAAATLFHNNVKDKISSSGSCTNVSISSCSFNPTADYSINVDRAKTWGLELSSKVQLNKDWSVRAGYTWTHSEVIEGGVKTGQLAQTAKHIANAQLDWTPEAKWRLWMRGELRGKSPRYSGLRSAQNALNQAVWDNTGNSTKGYGLLHIGGSYELSKAVTLSANIFNLLDKDFRKYTAFQNGATTSLVSDYFHTGTSVSGTAPAGRTVWITANVKF